MIRITIPSHRHENDEIINMKYLRLLVEMT